jgi:hypothetical protein
METQGVKTAKTLIADEAAVRKRFQQIFPTLLSDVKIAALTREPTGTCTITGDVVISLWQYLLRLSSVGDWKIDPDDRTSLIPSDYDVKQQSFTLDSNAIRLLGFTNQFLTFTTNQVVTTDNRGKQTVTTIQSPATLSIITKLDQLESAFNAHANRAALNDAKNKNIDPSLVSYRPLATFGSSDGKGSDNFYNTAGEDITSWRIVRARRVRPVRNAWDTVTAHIELTLASPKNATLPLLFGDRDQIVYCELDVGEAVRRPYPLPEPGLEPLCPDETSAKTWSVIDLVNLIRARAASGDGSWKTHDTSVTAIDPRNGIPVRQVSGFIPGFGAKGRETTNHGNFRLTGITEVAAPFSLDNERQYILTFGFLGKVVGDDKVIETSQVQVFGDQSLLIYGCL